MSEQTTSRRALMTGAAAAMVLTTTAAAVPSEHADINAARLLVARMHENDRANREAETEEQQARADMATINADKEYGAFRRRTLAAIISSANRSVDDVRVLAILAGYWLGEPPSLSSLDRIDDDRERTHAEVVL